MSSLWIIISQCELNSIEKDSLSWSSERLFEIKRWINRYFKRISWQTEISYFDWRYYRQSKQKHVNFNEERTIRTTQWVS